MKEVDAPCYTQEHIDRCAEIIDGYLASVGPLNRLSAEQITEHVKNACITLNELNDECLGMLIETEHKNELCQLILVAAANAGLQIEDDITLIWREW